MACEVNGDGDMYGLGIRVGFYLQWFGAILAAWIAPGEVPGLRLINVLFSTTTFLATIIQVAKGSRLQPVEIYIIMLLNFASALYLLPILSYRFVTGYSPRLDPTRYPRSPPPSKTFNALQTVLLIAVMAFQVWFWTIKTALGAKTACQPYGFLFYKIRLQALWFRVLNCVICAVILLFLVYLLLCSFWKMAKEEPTDEKEDRTSKRILILQITDTFMRVVVLTSVVAATELTIRWNNISGVSSTGTSGQLIPLCLGIAVVVRVIYKSCSEEPPKVQQQGPTREYMLPMNNTCNSTIPGAGLYFGNEW